jgi:hypothetical protein
MSARPSPVMAVAMQWQCFPPYQGDLWADYIADANELIDAWVQGGCRGAVLDLGGGWTIAVDPPAGVLMQVSPRGVRRPIRRVAVPRAALARL